MKWIPIFRGGEQTDSTGKTKKWSDEDLDAIVNNYNSPDRSEDAPVVIGHPKTDDPAFGWVDKLKRVGDTVFAMFKDVDEQFKEMVNKGRFKYRSVALHPDLRLRHVGFLGAAAPAIKGLGAASFADGEFTEIELEFSEQHANVITRFFNAIQDMMTDMPELFAEKQETDSDDDDDKKDDVDDKNIEEDDMSDEKQFTQADLDAQKTTVENEFNTKLSARDTEIATLKKQLADKEAKQRTADFESFCDGLAPDGQELTPKSRTAIMQFMESIATVEEYEFTEGDSTVKLTPVQQFQNVLKNGVEFMQLDEQATKDKVDTKTGTAGEKLTLFAKDIQKENKDFTFTQAFAKACADHPELAQEYERTMQ